MIRFGYFEDTSTSLAGPLILFNDLLLKQGAWNMDNYIKMAKTHRENSNQIDELN